MTFREHGTLTLLTRPHHSNDGQVTLWTSTPTVYTSYWSTDYTTVTEWVPCPVLTSTITTTVCSECNVPPPVCTDCSDPIPVITTCEVKACTDDYPHATLTTEYSPGDVAYATIGGALFQIDYTDCDTFYSPAIFATPEAEIQQCGEEEPDDPSEDDVTTVIYSYTSDGAIYVVETTMAVVGGPFHLSASGEGRRLDGGSANLLFWGWAVTAFVAATGMIVL
jgi:hypothetical protein